MLPQTFFWPGGSFFAPRFRGSVMAMAALGIRTILARAGFLLALSIFPVSRYRRIDGSLKLAH